MAGSLSIFARYKNTTAERGVNKERQNSWGRKGEGEKQRILERK